MAPLEIALLLVASSLRRVLIAAGIISTATLALMWLAMRFEVETWLERRRR